MDLLSNVNTIVSIIVGLITIGTAIGTVFAKRSTVQRTIDNPSTPIEIRLRLEDQWSGTALWAKIIRGIIGAGLVGVFSTIVVTFMINFFLAFQVFLQDMSKFSRASDYSHLSIGNRSMPGRIYRTYSPPLPYGPPYRPR